MTFFNIGEESLKIKIAHDYFSLFDCSNILGNVDFCVTLNKSDYSQHSLFEIESLLWAEAKKNASDIYKSVTQLILTIGKARTFDTYLPPSLLSAFDAEKIAFVPYSEITDIFYQNDFNWNVTPSNPDTKEFQSVLQRVKSIIDDKALLFYYAQDEKELKKFIKTNFVIGKIGLTKTRIDKNNFMIIYNKWLQTVKHSIAVDWDIAKKSGIIDGDFYLADLLSAENNTLKEKLFVLLKHDHYELDRKLNNIGLFSTTAANFKDNQKAHTQFWNKYDRPPKEEYWDYIVERRDLLVPQDVRERKGSFFTPQIWVELSQQYLADVLGEDWQEEYYVWDCAAGTGNLLTGLTNKYNIWASTLDTQDVDVMHERINTMNANSPKGDGSNLLHDHVFQFDFLNDDFDKLPKPLKAIIDDEEKRKKLVMYINPPYAEDTTKTTISGTGKNKTSVAQNVIHDRYATLLKKANHELFTQFLTRIYLEIPDSKIANFSKLKNLQSSNFSDFRQLFRAKLKKIFLVQANTFDNVTGQFPIGFFIWDNDQKEIFEKIEADVYDKEGNLTQNKTIVSNDNIRSINRWIKQFDFKSETIIGFIPNPAPDFQHNNQTFLQSEKGTVHVNYTPISKSNLIEAIIYFATRKSIEPTWLNDRDQFLFPNDGWKIDTEFQNDCLAFTLFNNNIQSKYGINHWIPFTEREINAREKFDSNFMTNFIQGKLKQAAVTDMFAKQETRTTPLQFSAEATAVFNAGRELWKYYHAQPNCNVNASLYDIRESFQGRNEKGKMNNTSKDETYSALIANLRLSLKALAKKIEPKVYECGFLKA